MKLAIHDYAPDFSLVDQTGETHTLHQYHGHWVLLYFYPKDDTPGCTTEACSIRDSLPKFTTNHIVVLGVSKDSVASHARFAQKYGLPFTLLADEAGAACETYGVWGGKSFMGKKFLGIHRTSFLIDPAGKIAKIYENVKPAKHVAEVLADIAQLSQI